jgi:hypothetical protein
MILLRISVFVNRGVDMNIKIVKLCNYGKQIKKRLVDIDHNQEWLISQVREKTGLYFDDSYLYKIMVGKNKPEKIITAINEVLSIIEVESDAS